MPTTAKLRNKLLSKLKELFQLDKPDLDFGFYRIMQAKAKQVETFIEKDLLKIIEDAFGQVDEGRKAELQANIEKEIAAAKEYGVAEPENSPKVKEAKARYEALKDTATAEADVYDHLYRFFERYYDDGDFISRRYYTRENSGKAAPFAIPYNGEEVKLHWANADQYYIKTAEYFSNFTFDITQAAEIRKMSDDEKVLKGIPKTPLKIHFRIVEAGEGEHGNIKETDDKKRFFVLHEETPVEITVGANNHSPELVVNFEYKSLPGGKNDVGEETEEALKEAYGKSINKRDMPNLAIAAKIIKAVEKLINHETHEKHEMFLPCLELPSPTDKISNRPLLAKYINQYTSRNTCDYFIHKDLGGFLKRELDFYIKNEVMHLDDIENADVPVVESYLAKLRVIRKIAAKLIEFLAQLEDFQKKLWLKKKFVVETNYCITLDRVPHELYPYIAANDAQREEWVKLFAIDEIKGNDTLIPGMRPPGYSVPLTIDFLKANDKLVLDTAFFSGDFKTRLVESINDFDESIDGVLINADNLQSAILLTNRYRFTINGVYLDPPYNTDASEIIYKNGYKNSSWASLMYDRLLLIRQFQKSDGCICVTIDDFEKNILREHLDTIYGSENDLSTVVIRSNPQGRSTVQGFSINHEYGLFYKVSNDFRSLGRLVRSDKQINRYNEIDKEGKRYLWENFRKTGTDSTRIDRPKQFYPIIVKENKFRIPEMEWNDEDKKWNILEKIGEDEYIVYPIDEDSNERVWKWGHDRVKAFPAHIKIESLKNGSIQVYRRNYLNNEGALPGTWWDKGKYGAGSHGTNLLTAMFGKGHSFPFPKSLYAVEDCLRIISNNNRFANILDFFGGSGTTAHAVIDMNRADKGKRKYLLTEMGLHFDEVLIPRIKKTIYSVCWDGGKPQNFKSYLNNLKKRQKELKDELENLTGYQNINEYQYDRQQIVGEITLLETETQEIENFSIKDTTGLLGCSHILKYIRLESYEDTLNNLEFDKNETREDVINKNDSLREDYMLHYLLDVETRGSQSLLNIDNFVDPTSYTLKIKRPGSDEQVTKNVDLIETFNYLIGLRLENMAVPQTFTASFTRKPDPELPEDQYTKLVVKDKIRPDENGKWWFRKVDGWVPADLMNPNNGQKEKVLIVWRKLTGNLEEDNLMLDEWFKKFRINSLDFEYDTIYVNGSNNLPNLRKDDEHWKVRLIEEEFHKRMWETE